jgi:hypothetical protein
MLSPVMVVIVEQHLPLVDRERTVDEEVRSLASSETCLSTGAIGACLLLTFVFEAAAIESCCCCGTQLLKVVVFVVVILKVVVCIVVMFSCNDRWKYHIRGLKPLPAVKIFRR